MPDVASKARRLRLRLTRVTLAQVLRQITVTESCQSGRSRSYRLHLQFLPRAAYREEFAVTPASVLQYVEDVWVRRLLKKLAQTFQLKDVGGVLEKEAGAAAEREVDTEDADQPGGDGGGDPAAQEAADDPAAAEQKQSGDEDNSDIEAEADDDATAARSKARHNDEADYESAEEDDEAAGEQSRPGSPEWDEAEHEDDEEAVAANPKRTKDAQLRRAAVCALSLESCLVTQYDFDQKHERWCRLTVVVSWAATFKFFFLVISCFP